MTFFNQPQTPCGGVAFSAPGRFTFNLAALPASIEVLTITLAIDGQGQVTQFPPSHLDILANDQAMARFDFSGALFAGERAVMLFEFYRKDGAWRLCPVGQGFDGGLDALVTHFGGEVAVPSPKPISAPSPAKVSLEKRIEKEAPQLVSLVKQAKVSLEKTGLGRHRARVSPLRSSPPVSPGPRPDQGSGGGSLFQWMVAYPGEHPRGPGSQARPHNLSTPAY